MTILKNAIDTEDEGELAKLDPIIQSYRKIVADLLAMSIPQDSVNIHLGFLNSMSNILANVEAMRQSFSDPIKAFAGLSQYQKHLDDLSVATQKIKDYYESNL